MNPRVQVISVESERASGFYASMKGIENALLFSLLHVHFSGSTGDDGMSTDISRWSCRSTDRC